MALLGEVTVTRRTWASPAGWSAGTFDKGASADSSIFGTFRPAPIAVVQILAEGDRVRDPHVLYTTTALQTNSQHNGTPPDYVSIDGGTTWYEVTNYGIHDQSLPLSPIAHRKYVCIRVQEADG
jgi:hypothetical protein